MDMKLLFIIMEFVQMCIFVILLIQVFTQALTEKLAVGWNSTISNQTLTLYNIGVSMGIINPEKYSVKSFESDEPLFKHMYKDFASWADIEPMTYQQFLILNNYGLLADTQESIFQNKTRTRSKRRSKKKRFKRILNTGDILISSRSDSGLIGHAAIMVSDYWVLEMAGGRKYEKGIKSNNRQISKSDWFDDNCSEEITVYRCPDSEVAENAAYWADTNYYNPYGGQEKLIHVTYKITPDSFRSTDPSYSSKLVLQAYYYGASGVVRDVKKYASVIAPTTIPAYFMSPYHLEIIGKF